MSSWYADIHKVEQMGSFQEPTKILFFFEMDRLNHVEHIYELHILYISCLNKLVEDYCHQVIFGC